MAERTAENNGSGINAAVAFAAWALILVIAFLADRGDDVGQIGQLAGRLGGGPLLGPGIGDSLAGAVSALIIVLAWFTLGSFITSFINAGRSEAHSHILEIVLNIAVGAAAWSVVWFFLGLAGLYTSYAAAFTILIGFLLGILAFTRVRGGVRESRVPERFSISDKVVIALILVPVVLAFVASLAPPTAKDTLLYHLALPKAFIAQGSNAFIEGNIASYLALGAEMHNVWAMLFGRMVSDRAGEAAAGAVNWAFLPLLLAAVFGWAREIGISRRWSLLTVLMVAAVPTVYYVAANEYTDVALALFVAVAVYALTRWWKTVEWGWLAYIAIFLGAALSIKLTTVVVMAAFALVIMFRGRMSKDTDPNSTGRIFGGGFAALILAVLIASPWYLRNWRATGSPVFPFYLSIWKGEAAGWDVERSNLFQAMNSQYGGASKTAVDYLAAPWNLSVRAQPESAENFDGVLGVAFLAGIPLLIAGLWKLNLPVELKIGVGIAGIMYLFWLFSSQQLRYLLPVIPVLAIAISASAERLLSKRSGVVQLSFIAASVAAIAVSFAWFLRAAPLRVVLGGESRDAYLSRNLDHYPYYRLLNLESPGDAKVWLINMRRDTYHLDRPAISDYLFEDWTLRKMLWGSRSAEELKARAAAMAVQYILTRHDFLFDYDRSTLVDDDRGRSENEKSLNMAKALLLDPARTVRADEKFSLVKIY